MFANVIVAMALMAAGQLVTIEGATPAQHDAIVQILTDPASPPIERPITVTLHDGANFSGCSGISVNQYLEGTELMAAVLHEYGHVFDCQKLTDEDRAVVIAATGEPDRAWYGGDYMTRPAERWADSFAQVVWLRLGWGPRPFDYFEELPLDVVAMVIGDRPVLSDNRPILRGELASMLARLGYASPTLRSFPDVPLGSPYYPDVTAAAGAGMFVGYADGTFRPDSPASAYEVGLVLSRMADYAMHR